MIPKPGTDAHAERPGFIETTRVSGSRQGDTMNELIEKLKDNDAHRIFADMTPAEQACLKAMGQNLECLGSDMIWYAKEGRLFDNSVYRIKSNYQPQPEYVDLEITICKAGGYQNNRLCVWMKRNTGSVDSFTWMPIDELPSLPGFRGFLDDKGSTLQITWIAERISRGQKVIARFDK